MEENILIMIRVMSRHTYTSAMGKSTSALAEVLKKNGFVNTANALLQAAKQMKETVGKLK